MQRTGAKTKRPKQSTPPKKRKPGSPPSTKNKKGNTNLSGSLSLYRTREPSMRYFFFSFFFSFCLFLFLLHYIYSLTLVTSHFICPARSQITRPYKAESGRKKSISSTKNHGERRRIASCHHCEKRKRWGRLLHLHTGGPP